MDIKLRRLQFQSNRLPGEIQLVLSDAETNEEAKVWITARFPLEELSNDRLAGIGISALNQLKNLISEGQDNASKEPGAPDH